jgi:hypothetical protein
MKLRVLALLAPSLSPLTFQHRMLQLFCDMYKIFDDFRITMQKWQNDQSLWLMVRSLGILSTVGNQDYEVAGYNNRAEDNRVSRPVYQNACPPRA